MDAAVAAGVSRETLEEHLELAHYIEVFRSSAEYVRRVIFVILVFSVLMLIAQWNTTSPSWIVRRFNRLQKVYADVKALEEPAADATVFKRTDKLFPSREELHEFLSEYRGRRVERVVLVEIPGLGVTFDINDLGNFCGIAYAIMLVLLILALVREHENLYLALFKVRRLHDREAKPSDGESKANYLYHTLAMSQVLTSPPTLAQWRQPAVKRAFLNLVLFVPAAVQAYIILTNLATLNVAQVYGADGLVMVPQYLFFAISVALGIVALIYAQACNHRWKSAFLYVNPALKFVGPQPWGLWIKRPTKLPKEPMQRRLWAQAISELTLAQEPTTKTISVDHAKTLKDPCISYTDVVEMCAELEAQAMQKARVECPTPRLVSASVTSSVLAGTVWEVSADFGIHC